MISSSEKNYQCFIGYKYDDDYKIKPLRIMFPQAKDYVESYDGEIKWLYFLLEDNELLKKIS